MKECKECNCKWTKRFQVILDKSKYKKICQESYFEKYSRKVKLSDYIHNFGGKDERQEAIMVIIINPSALDTSWM